MLVKCTSVLQDKIEAYLQHNESSCLYLCLDYYKYGLNCSFTEMYAEMENNNIRCLIFRYHEGVHIFSKNGDFDINTVVSLIKKMNPNMICCIQEIADQIKVYLGDYEVTFGSILKLEQINTSIERFGRIAKIDELDEVATLLCQDEGIGGTYNFSQMSTQLKERYNDNFGRNYILKQNHEIIAHAATGAEYSNIAIINGVITAPSYRGKGIGTSVLATLCDQLLQENKKIYSICYIPQAQRMHEKVGFNKCESWAKLSKKEIV